MAKIATNTTPFQEKTQIIINTWLTTSLAKVTVS